jgi:hypothetical protein
VDVAVVRGEQQGGDDRQRRRRHPPQPVEHHQTDRMPRITSGRRAQKRLSDPPIQTPIPAG